jgi:hypothetical protein
MTRFHRQSLLSIKKQVLNIMTSIRKCIFLVPLIILVACSEDASWIPSDYIRSGLDSNIAFKIVDPKAVSRSWGYSQKVSFISNTECESLFVEVALKDANGNIIGTTNDGYDKSISKGQVITLDFMSPNKFVEISGRNINCL